MVGLHWITDNWVIVLNAIGVVGGLCFTAVSYRTDTKTRKISNFITIITNHREIWKELLHRSDLKRILNPKADLTKTPVTPAEAEFVGFVILHLCSVYYATQDKMVIELEGARQDVKAFFSLPLPNAVWLKTKIFQNEDFVAFVEECRMGVNIQTPFRTPHLDQGPRGFLKR